MSIKSSLAISATTIVALIAVALATASTLRASTVDVTKGDRLEVAFVSDAPSVTVETQLAGVTVLTRLPATATP